MSGNLAAEILKCPAFSGRKQKKAMRLDPQLTASNAGSFTLYFGTGLASTKEPSQGFGFEFLTTILSAIWLQQKFGFRAIIHEISTVGFSIKEEEKAPLLQQERTVVDRIISALGVSQHYEVIYSERYHEDRRFHDIENIVASKLSTLDGIPRFQDFKRYSILQITGMRYLYETRMTRVKVGWITDAKVPPAAVSKEFLEPFIQKCVINEFYFDCLYRYVFPEDTYSFIYTPPGFNLINDFRGAPYTVTPSHIRPILGRDNLRTYLTRKDIMESTTHHTVIRQWQTMIVEMYEFTSGMSIPSSVAEDDEEETVEKIQWIVDHLLGVPS